MAEKKLILSESYKALLARRSVISFQHKNKLINDGTLKMARHFFLKADIQCQNDTSHLVCTGQM